MSEKKANIENGKNVELDGLTVINEGIVLSEDKVEEKKEEVAVEVPTEEEKKEDVSTSEDELPQDNAEIASEEASATEEKSEEPEQAEQSEQPVIPIDLPGDITGEIPSVSIPDPFADQAAGIELPTEEPTQDYQSSDLNIPTSFDTTTGSYTGYDDTPSSQTAFDDTTSYGSFANNNVFSNFGGEQQEELPDGIKTALDMVQNEVKEIIRENSSLKNENDKLKIENGQLKNENANLQSQIQILKNEKANMQNSITNVQSRILDVFGASNLMGYSNSSSNAIQDSNTGLNIGNFGDAQMSNGGMGIPLQ